MMFFFVFFAQFVVMVVQTIGIPTGGTIGLILALEQFNGSGIGSIFVGIFCLCIAACFGIATAGTLTLLAKVFVFCLMFHSTVTNSKFPFLLDSWNLQK